MSNFNHTNFIGLTKIAEFEKSAVVMETEWGEKNPGLSLAADLGISAIPYVGTAAGLYDAYNSFRNGSVWGGLGNLALAGLGLIPIPGVAAAFKGLAKGTKAALKAAKGARKANKTLRQVNKAIQKSKAIDPTNIPTSLLNDRTKAMSDVWQYMYDTPYTHFKNGYMDAIKDKRVMPQWEAWTRAGVGLAGETGKYEGVEAIHNNRAEERKNRSDAGWNFLSNGFNPYSNTDTDYSTDSNLYNEYGGAIITH